MTIRSFHATVAVAVALTVGAPAFAQDAATPMSGSQEMSSEMLPPNAQPGRCYARTFVPPTYRDETVRVLVQTASQELAVTPAQFAWGEERILIKEAGTRIEVLPARYEWREEQILVKPAHAVLDVAPADYETITERVVDAPAHTVWKRGRGPIERVDNGTGEIMCLVEVPATYKDVEKTVLKDGPAVSEITIPAEYQSVRKQVLAEPASTRVVEIPAEYETIRVQRLVQVAGTQSTEIPEEYRTVSRRVMDADGHMEWREILCETNVSNRVMMDLQRALVRAGYDPGPIDGDIGQESVSAIRAFQRDNGLAVGTLTIELLEKLGIRIGG